MCPPIIKSDNLAATDQPENETKELECPSVAQIMSELAVPSPSAHGSDEIKLQPEEEENIFCDIQTTFQKANEDKGSFTFEYYINYVHQPARC
jgi:hypothetical protein